MGACRARGAGGGESVCSAWWEGEAVWPEASESVGLELPAGEERPLPSPAGSGQNRSADWLHLPAKMAVLVARGLASLAKHHGRQQRQLKTPPAPGHCGDTDDHRCLPWRRRGAGGRRPHSSSSNSRLSTPGRSGISFCPLSCPPPPFLLRPTCSRPCPESRGGAKGQPPSAPHVTSA